jgi:hypothetical protein
MMAALKQAPPPVMPGTWARALFSGPRNPGRPGGTVLGPLVLAIRRDADPIIAV